MLDLMRGWETHIILVYHQEWSPINQLILELLTTPLTAIIVSTPIWMGQIPVFSSSEISILYFYVICHLRELIIDKNKSNVILLVNGQQKPVVSERDL